MLVHFVSVAILVVVVYILTLLLPVHCQDNPYYQTVAERIPLVANSSVLSIAHKVEDFPHHDYYDVHGNKIDNVGLFDGILYMYDADDHLQPVRHVTTIGGPVYEHTAVKSKGEFRVDDLSMYKDLASEEVKYHEIASLDLESGLNLQSKKLPGAVTGEPHDDEVQKASTRRGPMVRISNHIKRKSSIFRHRLRQKRRQSGQVRKGIMKDSSSNIKKPKKNIYQSGHSNVLPQDDSRHMRGNESQLQLQPSFYGSARDVTSRMGLSVEEVKKVPSQSSNYGKDESLGTGLSSYRSGPLDESRRQFSGQEVTSFVTAQDKFISHLKTTASERIEVSPAGNAPSHYHTGHFAFKNQQPLYESEEYNQ